MNDVVGDRRKEYNRSKLDGGKVVIDSGDDVAVALRELDLPDIYNVAAKELGIAKDQLIESYKHLNKGMQRMTLGNRIRGIRNRIRKAEEAEQAKADKAVVTEVDGEAEMHY